MTELELRHLLAQWNSTHRDFPADSCLHQLFEEQVIRQPGAVAVISKNQQLTYRELDERANRLASFLRKRGVGPEVLVGICLERSIDLVVAILGVLKAGGAYVPLDPAYPLDRLLFMIDDVKVTLLVTDSQVRQRLAKAGCECVLVDIDKAAIAREPIDRTTVPVSPQNLAYIIYTSGSTGRPKGIALRHQGVVNNVTDLNARFAVGREDRILAISSLSFDMSVYEVLGILAAGGALVLPDPAKSRDADHLVSLIIQHEITIWNSAPALLVLLVDHLGTESNPPRLPLRLALLGGDWVPVDLPTRTRALVPSIEFVVLGGATEASIHSTIYRVDQVDPAWKSIPYGRPMANQVTYVLDEIGRPVAPGIAGELHIGGIGLARGYFNRPDLTAEKFIANAFGAGRLYRTGDLVRWMPDGNLELLGRIDHQVKIRGFRVELGEIESVMRQHAGIKHAVVVARGDNENRYLAAYFVAARRDIVPTTKELLAHIRDRLPEYMVPMAFVSLESLPLSPNGKVDRGALPEPIRNNPANDWTPRTPTEEVLATIWAEVLKLDCVGVNHDFLEVGGNSLLAAQIAARLRRALGIDLGLQTVLELPTIASLAAEIDSRAALTTSASVVQRVDRAREIPASFGQRQMWLIDQLEPGRATYNVSLKVHLLTDQDLNIDAVKASLSEVVRRHEVMRTTFREKRDLLVQIISDDCNVLLEIVDLRTLPEAARAARVEVCCLKEATRPFNLAQGPLFRATLIRCSERENILLGCLHHAISDGWSLAVLMREFHDLYVGFVTANPPSLDVPAIQYADYSAWQNDILSKTRSVHANYWKRKLEGAETLELPTDLAHPRVRRRKGKRVEFLIPNGLRQRLEQIARQERVTPFIVLLAALKELLHRSTGQTDIVLGTVVANRFPAETESLIGYFANTVVLRTDLSGKPSFRELLGRVRKVVMEAYAHQEIPFTAVVEALRETRNTKVPHIRAMFVLQNSILPPSSTVLRMQTKELYNGEAMFDLTLQITDAPHGYDGAVDYDVDLFTHETIQRLVLQLMTSCESLPDTLNAGRFLT